MLRPCCVDPFFRDTEQRASEQRASEPPGTAFTPSPLQFQLFFYYNLRRIERCYYFRACTHLCSPYTATCTPTHHTTIICLKMRAARSLILLSLALFAISARAQANPAAPINQQNPMGWLGGEYSCIHSSRSCCKHASTSAHQTLYISSYFTFY